jgi:hypothetical protein
MVSVETKKNRTAQIEIIDLQASIIYVRSVAFIALV